MADKAGRKDKYTTDVKPRLDDIKEWARALTEEQICQRLGVSRSAWTNYKKAHPELKQTIIEGRSTLVYDLKETMIRRALGYDAKESKVVEKKFNLNFKQKAMLKALGYTDDDFKFTVTEKITQTKHFAPDVTALNKLLLNFDKDWKNDPDASHIRCEELALKKKLAETDSKEWEAYDTK